ncbi:FAD/NAD(P)-binding domain-containing protein [Aspergillus unguis]
MNKPPPFKVIIIGGSIAGLTLAHCLARAQISHIVLEKRAEKAPQEGASIGLWPTGAQILDQLGLWAAVSESTEPLKVHNVLYPGGRGFSHDVLARVYERFGYGLTFVERQRLLSVLYKSYPDKENILLGKTVVQAQQDHHSASVTTSDGSVYKGTLVVGADGVHSGVRSEMYRLIHASKQIQTAEKNPLTAEYSCVFGISSPIPGLQPGEHGNVFGDGVTVLTFHGKTAVYWFVCSKMDRKYIYPDIPRFSAKDAEELCAGKYAGMRLADEVTVRDLWKSRKAGGMVAMEEGLFEKWSCGRVVLMGDAVRKVVLFAYTALPAV